MRLLPERVIKAKKPKAEKRIYTKNEIEERDKFGFRARDYFITMLSCFLSFIIIYYYFHWDALKSFLLVLLVAIIVLMILRRLIALPKKEQEKEGWLITWIDARGIFNIPSYHNMKLVWGKAKALPDGTLEAIPESFITTYYKKRDKQRRFNPMLPNCINMLKDFEDMGEPVFFCDGTDRFVSPMQAMVNKSKVLKSAGLTPKNITMTTDWMKRKGTVVEGD